MISVTEKEAAVAMLAWFAQSLDAAGMPAGRLGDVVLAPVKAPAPGEMTWHGLLRLYQELRIDHGAQPITGAVLDMLIKLGSNLDPLLLEEVRGLYRTFYTPTRQKAAG